MSLFPTFFNCIGSSPAYLFATGAVGGLIVVAPQAVLYPKPTLGLLSAEVVVLDSVGHTLAVVGLYCTFSSS